MHRRALALAGPLCVLLADCNAGVGVEAQSAPTPPPSPCKQPRVAMRQFYTLLDQGEFAGLKKVIEEDLFAADVEGNIPIFTVLRVLSEALADFADDPPEAPDRMCLDEPPPAVEFGNRLCRVRRLMTLLLHDGQVEVLLDQMVPLLHKFMEYIEGRIAVDGVAREHYEMVATMHNMTAIGGKCDPTNLFSLLRAVVTYLTPARAREMLDNTRALLGHPAIKQLLTSYESDSGDVGLDAYVTLASLLIKNIHDIDRNDKVGYFDAIWCAPPCSPAGLLNTLADFADSLTEGAALADMLNVTAADLKAMTHPDQGILAPLQDVVECIWAADGAVTPPGRTLYAGFYDLFLNANVLNIPDLLDAAGALVTVDSTGEVSLSLGDTMEVLAQSEDAQRAMNTVLEAITRDQNARVMIPTMRVMLEKNVLDEFGTLAEQLLYGCTP